MKIIQADAVLMGEPDGRELLKKIEQAGRICYKSENRITEGSAETFVRGIIRSGHEAVLEHASVSVKFICDRGVSHEIVRHRVASYCQESTRYCNYAKSKFGNELTVISPCFWAPGGAEYLCWEAAMRSAEEAYLALLRLGATPEQARSVLPNSLKTELVMTANLREWRHFFRLRCSGAAHPQIREVAAIALQRMKAAVPVVFDDLDPGEAARPEHDTCRG